MEITGNNFCDTGEQHCLSTRRHCYVGVKRVPFVRIIIIINIMISIIIISSSII